MAEQGAAWPISQRIDKQTDCEITWNWLKNGYLKKETEGFIMAAQDQAIRTNAIKAKDTQDF